MVDAVEEFLQVHVYHDLIAVLHMLLRFQYGVARSTARAKPVAVLVKSGVDPRLQHLQNGLLDKPVHYGGNTQFTFAAIWFGDADATHRTGPVRACHQLFSDGR